MLQFAAGLEPPALVELGPYVFLVQLLKTDWACIQLNPRLDLTVTNLSGRAAREQCRSQREYGELHRRAGIGVPPELTD